MEASNDENQLIAKIRSGEREAFRVLVERHEGSVYRVCRQLLRDDARAEDLAQDAFVRAYQHLHQFDASKGRFVVWLLTIARRLCLNALTKETRMPVAQPSGSHASEEEAPDEMAARADTFRSLDEALSELSEDHRRAFVLAEIEDLSHEEIATIESVAIGTVKSRVSRAKQALRDSLRDTYKELKERV